MKSVKNALIYWGLFFVIILGILSFFYFKNFRVEGSTIDQNPKISVVIPVYNTEQYLPECLNSVLNQTYKNLEVICVNDGSKDGSLKLLQDYAEKDNRIKIIDQENQGVSAARNSGIKAATGEYLHFVDSDDYIDLATYETCINKIIQDKFKRKDIDVLVFDWTYFPEGNNNRSIPKKTYINNSFKAILEDKFANFIWNKIYKTSIIQGNEILFKEDISYCEDDLFVLIVLPHAKNITLMPKKFYHYRQASVNSLSTQVNVEKELKYAVLRGKYLVEDWEANGYDQWGWLLEKVRWGTYPRIMKLENDELKAMYSKQTMEILDGKILPHINKNNLSEAVKKEFETMRKYAEKAE